MSKPDPRSIQAVVFDLDNTLLRSTIGARRGLILAAKLISHHLDRNGNRYGASGLLSQLKLIDREMLRRKFLYNRDVWWKTLLEELGEPARASWVHSVTMKYWHAYQTNSPPFADAESTLRKLKKSGMKIGMVSDYDGTPGMKRRRIRALSFHRMFEAIVVSGEDTPRVKPGHESFRLVSEKLSVDPQACIYVADNPRTDLSGAEAVGMRTVLVKRRGNGWGKPSYRIPRLRALPGLVRAIRRESA